MSMRIHDVALENITSKASIPNNQEKIHDAFLCREDHVLGVCVTIEIEKKEIKCLLYVFLQKNINIFFEFLVVWIL